MPLPSSAKCPEVRIESTDPNEVFDHIVKILRYTISTHAKGIQETDFEYLIDLLYKIEAEQWTHSQKV